MKVRELQRRFAPLRQQRRRADDHRYRQRQQEAGAFGNARQRGHSHPENVLQVGKREREAAVRRPRTCSCHHSASAGSFATVLAVVDRAPSREGRFVALFGIGLCRTASACEHGFAGNLMQKEYVKIVEGAYRIGDTRVSLDSIVYLFREGLSAESMVESYPSVTLEQVHGALAFYLANQ